MHSTTDRPKGMMCITHGPEPVSQGIEDLLFNNEIGAFLARKATDHMFEKVETKFGFKIPLGWT